MLAVFGGARTNEGWCCACLCDVRCLCVRRYPDGGNDAVMLTTERRTAATALVFSGAFVRSQRITSQLKHQVRNPGYAALGECAG